MTTATLTTAPIETASTGPNLLAGLKAVFEAMGDGLAAHRNYETLRARGVPHAEAAARSLGTIKSGV